MDTTFREDHSQIYIGHAAKNLGALRRIVLNLLKLGLPDTNLLANGKWMTLERKMGTTDFTDWTDFEEVGEIDWFT